MSDDEYRKLAQLLDAKLDPLSRDVHRLRDHLEGRDGIVAEVRDLRGRVEHHARELGRMREQRAAKRRIGFRARVAAVWALIAAAVTAAAKAAYQWLAAMRL